MRELKASKKEAKRIIESSKNYKGYSLETVYTSYSVDKARAYKWCLEQYNKTDDAYGFHICSSNTFGFCVAWYGTKNNERIMRYETKDNSYLVWLDR